TLPESSSALRKAWLTKGFAPPASASHSPADTEPTEGRMRAAKVSSAIWAKIVKLGPACDPRAFRYRRIGIFRSPLAQLRGTHRPGQQRQAAPALRCRESAWQVANIIGDEIRLRMPQPGMAA